MIANFNKHYPALLRALHAFGDVIMGISQAVIVSLGVPVLLALLLYVEVQRVKHGIALFEQSATLASLGAWALVMANLSLEFVIYYVESRNHYEQSRSVAWSLRVFWSDLRYWMGFGEWQPRVLSPAHEWRKALKLVTFAILALALTGSMQSVMVQQSGPWYAGMMAIITDGTLIDVTTWAGGLLFTFAAVRLAQVMTGYIARRVSEAVAKLEANEDGREPSTKQTAPTVSMTDIELDSTTDEAFIDESATLEPPALLANNLQIPEVSAKQYHVSCPHCEWSGTYKTSQGAANALRGHLRHCPYAHSQPVSVNGNGAYEN